MGKKSKWKYRKREPEIAEALMDKHAADRARKDIWAGLIPALACFICCLALSILGQSDARTGMKSLGWSVTYGGVTGTYVVCNEHIDLHRSRMGSTSRSRTSCSAVVTYRYRAAGIEYTGKRFRIAANGADAYSSNSRKNCEEWAKKNYWPGKEVSVHYDPRDPGEAALEAGVSQTSIWFLIVGSLLAGPACFMALFALPENRRPSVLIRILICLAMILLIGGINMLAFPGEVADLLKMF